MLNLCFQLNGKKYEVLAVEDNSTNVMDQIYLLSTNSDEAKLKIKVDNKTYTILANKERGKRIFYIKTGVQDNKFKVGYSNCESTIAFKVNDKTFYGIKEIYIENYHKFVFIDGEQPTNQIIKFYKNGQFVDVFFETIEFFDAHPEKGIAYWTIDGLGDAVKIDPVEGSFHVGDNGVKDPVVVLRSTYKYLNKPLNSIETLGELVRNQVTSTSRTRDVTTGSSGGGGGGGGGSTGGGS